MNNKQILREQWQSLRRDWRSDFIAKVEGVLLELFDFFLDLTFDGLSFFLVLHFLHLFLFLFCVLVNLESSELVFNFEVLVFGWICSNADGVTQFNDELLANDLLELGYSLEFADHVHGSQEPLALFRWPFPRLGLRLLLVILLDDNFRVYKVHDFT